MVTITAHALHRHVERIGGPLPVDDVVRAVERATPALERFGTGRVRLGRARYVCVPGVDGASVVTTLHPAARG